MKIGCGETHKRKKKEMNQSKLPWLDALSSKVECWLVFDPRVPENREWGNPKRKKKKWTEGNFPGWMPSRLRWSADLFSGTWGSEISWTVPTGSRVVKGAKKEKTQFIQSRGCCGVFPHPHQQSSWFLSKTTVKQNNSVLKLKASFRGGEREWSSLLLLS